MEKVAPHKNARELEHRISEGERKIKAAQDRSMDAAKIVEAANLLQGLRVQLLDLQRQYIIPHTVFHMVHYLLDLHDRQTWPITAGGSIAVDLPGIVKLAVEVPSEPPF
jgi:hypothetical protein